MTHQDMMDFLQEAGWKLVSENGIQVVLIHPFKRPNRIIFTIKNSIPKSTRDFILGQAGLMPRLPHALKTLDVYEKLFQLCEDGWKVFSNDGKVIKITNPTKFPTVILSYVINENQSDFEKG